MITKRFKSIVLLSFIISVIVLFNSCLMGGVEKTASRASVAFTVDEAMAQRIAAAAEEEGLLISSAGSTSYRTLQRSVDYTNLFIDVAVKGDFEDNKTIQAVEDTSASFTSIPVGSSIYVEATAYYQNGENRTNLYEGQSKSFKVREGENQVIFVLHRTSGENGGNGGGEGGNGTVIPNVLPVNVIFIANSASGGASGNDGTEESPLDSIENAIGKIKAIVEDANTGHSTDEEWGIVLLSDLTGAQKVTTDADGFMSKLVIASKDSKAIKTIDGGRSNYNNGNGPETSDEDGSTLTVLSQNDVVLQCVNITGGWANYGGGINHKGKSLSIMPGVEIYGNKAVYMGAGIFAGIMEMGATRSIDLLISGCVIGGEGEKKNVCTLSPDNGQYGDGGGIGIYGPLYTSENYKVNCVIEDASIIGNEANCGGGLAIRGNTKLTIKSGTISQNTASSRGVSLGGSGGGIYFNDQYNGIFTLNMEGGSITSNKAEAGGAIESQGGTVNLYGGSISGNTTTTGKGNGIVHISTSNPGALNIKKDIKIGSNDYIFLSGSTLNLEGSFTGTSPVATLQPSRYVTETVIIEDANTTPLSASEFAAACANFKLADDPATPLRWFIDDNGKLQTNDIALYVKANETGTGASLTDALDSIDAAMTYLAGLESSGTDLSQKEIAIYIYGNLSAKQTVSGSLNAKSLSIVGACNIDCTRESPNDTIKSGGLEVTLEGVPVVLKNLEISSCSGGAVIIGDSLGKTTRLTFDAGVSIKGNYTNSKTPVYINNGATLTMKDGSEIKNNFITSPVGNTGPAANGVLVDSGATFDMQGGEIVENVYQKGNSYVGLYVCTGASFSMGGNATFVKENSTVSNYIVLGAGNKIRITKDLIAGEQCTIYYDDSASSVGDTIFEAASGVNVAAASNLFNFVCESGRALFIDSEGKLTDVNPNTINFYIAQGGNGDGSSAASPFGSITEAVAAMTDMSADYILNINGQLSGAQVIENFVSANAIYIKGTGNDAALTGGANVDNTLTIALDQYCSVPITISNIEISGAEETGLVVNNSKQQNAGINPLYRDVILKDGVQIINNGNGTDDYNGGGIYVGAKNILSISNDCIVEYNKAGSTGNGAGAYLYSNAILELKDNVAFAANNDIYVPLTTSIMIGGPLSQSQVATITPSSYELLTAQTASPIMDLGYEGFDDNYYPIIISTTTLAEVHSKFSVKPDGTENYQIDDQGYLKRQ